MGGFSHFSEKVVKTQQICESQEVRKQEQTPKVRKKDDSPSLSAPFIQVSNQINGLPAFAHLEL